MRSIGRSTGLSFRSEFLDPVHADCLSFSHNINFVCLAHDCEDIYLCEKCLQTHNGLHFAYIKEIKDIMEFNPQPKVDEINSLIASTSTQRVKQFAQYEAVLEKIKNEVQNLIIKAETTQKELVGNKATKDGIALDNLGKELQNIKKQYHQIDDTKSDHGRSLLTSYVEKYRTFEQNSGKLAQTLQATPNVSLSYKDVDEQLTSVLSAVNKAINIITSGYFGEPERAEMPQQVEIADIAEMAELAGIEKQVPVVQPQPQIKEEKLQPAKSLDFNIKNVVKETECKLKAAPGWSSMEYIESLGAIVIGDDLGGVGVYDALTYRSLSYQNIHTTHINAIRYDNKRKILLTASNDTTVKVLTMSKGASKVEVLNTLRGHTDKVWSMLMVEQFDTLYTSGREATIIGWDLSTYTIKHKFDTRGRDTTGTEMTYIPRLKLLAVSFRQGTIAFYNVETPSEMRSIRVYQKWLHALCYIESKDWLVAGIDVGTIKIWKVKDFDFHDVDQFKIPGGLPTAIAPVNNGKEVLIASESDSLVSLNLENGEYQTSTKFGFEKVLTFKFLPMLRKLLVASDEVEVAVAKF